METELALLHEASRIYEELKGEPKGVPGSRPGSRSGGLPVKLACWLLE
ncbi:hypothetical protein [Amycolatopsis sp. cmx-11-12]